MPSPINRVPPGLLSLLDIKSMGQNPIVLGDELQGVFQLTDLYVNSIAQAQQGTTYAITTPGAVLCNSGYLFQAQPGEILVIEKCCADVNISVLGAGQSYAFRLCVTGSGGTMVWVGPRGQGAAGEHPATYADRPLILMPGHSLAILFESVTAGATSFRIGANVASLRF